MSVKRKLTESEIIDIIENIDNHFILPEDVPEDKFDFMMERYNRIKLELKEQLENIEIYPKYIENIKEDIKKQYFKSLSDPGNSVGVLASMNLVEPVTQSQLSSHSNAALASIASLSGLPRMNELLSVGKTKLNVTRCRLSSDYITDEERKNLSIVRSKAIPVLEELFINDIILVENKNKKIEITNCESGELNDWLSELSESDREWYDSFQIFFPLTFLNECFWKIRIYLDKNIIFRHHLSPETIASTIEESFGDTRCVYSSVIEGIIDIYINTENIEDIENIIKNKKKKDFYNFSTFITEETKEEYFVKRMVLQIILSIKVSGTSGIQKIWYTKSNENNFIKGITIKDEWIMDCEGANLRELLNNPLIDHRTVIANNIKDVFSILGIEAARTVLINEIKNIVSFGGTFVDPSHYILLADAMTYSGILTPVNLHGLNKNISGILSVSSFEQSHKVLTDAPKKCAKDNLDSVSGRIIAGLKVGIGTGMFKTIVDVSKYKDVWSAGVLKNKIEEKVPEENNLIF